MCVCIYVRMGWGSASCDIMLNIKKKKTKKGCKFSHNKNHKAR